MVFWKLRGSAFVALVAVSVSVSAELLLSNGVRAESPAASGSSALQTAKPKKSPELLRQEIAELTKKIEAEPKVAKNYGRRGLRYRDLGEYDEALRDFDDAIARDPKDGRVYGFKAFIYRRRGNLAEAIKQLSIAIDGGADDARGRIERSVCYWELGDAKNALIDAEQATKMDPADPDAWGQLGLLHLDQSKFELARSSLSRAINLDPLDGQNYFFRAEANSKLNLKREAAEDREKAKRLGYLEIKSLKKTR